MRSERMRPWVRALLASVAAVTLILSACSSEDVDSQGGTDQAPGTTGRAPEATDSAAGGTDQAPGGTDQAPSGTGQAGIVEIEYSNSFSEPVEFDIIRVDWSGDAMLETASFGDGADLGISGTSPAQGSIEMVIPAGSADWLRLSFDSGDAPDGLTVTVVTSTGSTLTHVYGSED